MDKQVLRAATDVVSWVCQEKIYSAAKYLSEKLVVRAVRKRYKGKLPAKNQNFEMSLVIGRPNYKQKEFIKDCKKAGESFPVKSIQIKVTK